MDVDDLYGLPLERFVSERGALARELRSAGRRDEAAAVAALRKPSVAAWSVNQLVRTQRDAMDQLFAVGDALRSTQSDVLAGQRDASALRDGGEQVRRALNELLGNARGLLGAAGHELSPATLERVSETLYAAALDHDARGLASQGRLERELRHVGLGVGAGSAFVPDEPSATPVARPKPAAAKRRGRPVAGEDRDTGSDEPADRARHAKENAEAVQRAAREREQARERAQRDERQARREVDRADRARRAAEQRRDRAAEALRQADAVLAQACADADAAVDAHRRAKRQLELP